MGSGRNGVGSHYCHSELVELLLVNGKATASGVSGSDLSRDESGGSAGADCAGRDGR